MPLRLSIRNCSITWWVEPISSKTCPVNGVCSKHALLNDVFNSFTNVHQALPIRSIEFSPGIQLSHRIIDILNSFRFLKRIEFGKSNFKDMMNQYGNIRIDFDTLDIG